MSDIEQLEWKISIVEEVRELLLNRGASSIRSVTNKVIKDLNDSYVKLVKDSEGIEG